MVDQTSNKRHTSRLRAYLSPQPSPTNEVSAFNFTRMAAGKLAPAATHSLQPTAAPGTNALFPVFLKLEQFRVLAVGGGNVALENLTAILHKSPGTAVTVVAPRRLPGFEALLSQHPRVELRARPYCGDGDDHDFVFIATNDPALNSQISRAATAYWRRVATGTLVTFALFIVLNIVSFYITWPLAWTWLTGSGTFYTFVAVGFVAQLIDGLLGMGYGVVSAISLMSLGLSPVAVSASIHTAELFASGALGYQHYRFGNVNKRLFRVLLLPDVAGSVTGAFLLTYLGAQFAEWVKPVLAVYLLLLGLRILVKALRKQRTKRRKVKNAGWLAGAGGFLDSFGGGGWGPLVTSTLIANGRTPQYVIGTVSLVEFFVTFASALTFFTLIGISHWQIVAGLIVGGVAAAPLAARLAGRVPTRWMFLSVGLMVILWSLWALRKLF